MALVTDLLASGRSVVVYGSAGVGKTRLGREVEQHWHNQGATTVWVVATQAGSDLPFATFAAFAASAGSTRADPVAIIAELRERLGHGGAGRGVLIVDDGHWLDEASSAVIHQMVSSSAATVLMTVRSGEPAPDALAGLWKDDLLERVELQPLSTAETARLAASILGGGCRPGTGGALWEATGGNPLYVRELLEAGLASGSVENVDGLWGLRRELAVGNRLSTLIGARLDRLGPEEGLVAEVVALGEPLPTAIVEAMCGLAALEGAERAGLVTVVSDGDRSEVRIGHPLYAEVARSRLPGARARSLYRRLAEVLEATGVRRRSDFIRWLSFRLEGGQSVPLDVLLQGWAEASEAGERRLAERLARAAVGVAPADDRAVLALVDALRRQDRYEDVLDLLDRPLATSEAHRAEALAHRAKVLWRLDRTEEAHSLLAAAVPTIADPMSRAWILGLDATMLVALGEPGSAVDRATAIMGDEASGSRGTLAAMGALALGQAFAGKQADAARTVAAATKPDLRAQSEAFASLSWALPAEWIAAWLTGDLVAAERIALSLSKGARRSSPQDRAAGTVGLGWVAIGRGDVNTAFSCFSAADVPEREGTWVGLGTLRMAGLGWAHAFSGDADAAADALTAATAAPRRGDRWFDPCVDTGWAWLEALTSVGRAREQFCAIAEAAGHRGQYAYELHALHAVARLGDATVAPRLAELALSLDGPMAPLAAAHAGALASDDAAGLEAIAGTFEDQGACLLGAEAFLAAARLHDAQGRRGAARAAQARGAALLARCPGAAPPTIAQLRAPPSLTDRELEVARLAARGHSSAEIGRRLYVSVRTVDTHLAHVYDKLGVKGRGQLRAALGGDEPEVQ
jgi:DNA-binding CsgD family transcriptional regulator